MKISRILNLLYAKVFQINDTPQKIALGLGLGVFSGILPGTGPLASLFLAFVFRVNRASALLGSLLTNTWLSIVTFVLAVKVGSAILRVDWRQLQQDWISNLKGLHWLGLFKASVLKIIFPVMLGYLETALVDSAQVFAVVRGKRYPVMRAALPFVVKRYKR